MFLLNTFFRSNNTLVLEAGINGFGLFLRWNLPPPGSPQVSLNFMTFKE